MSTPTIVAAVQAAPVFGNRDATVQKAVALIAEAARNGARLVAFPETWVPGYPAWIYGAATWDDGPTKRAFERLQRNAVAVPSPATDALCKAARASKAMVVIGINERDAEYSRGTLFNSQLFISEEGEILGTHRKLMPTHAERILWGTGDGSTLHVFDTPVGRVGGLVCWEHWMPLARFAMHAKGEQIHIAAWPDLPEAHHLASRHYAFEGRCFVICVGSYCTMDDIPKDFEVLEAFKNAGEALFDQESGVILSGGSGIIGPDAEWVAGPVADREEIVYAEIDLARVGQEQLALDSVGHYNRPDVFRLTVDERPRPHALWLRDETKGLSDESLPDAREKDLERGDSLMRRESH